MSKSVGIIGTGPAGFGVIKELSTQVQNGALSNEDVSKIHIFETSSLMGAGLPYDPFYTEPEHLLNVSSSSFSIPNQGREFLEWITENKEKITADFKRIFEERCRKKIRERQLEGEEKEKLEAHYKTLWAGFEKRYLNLKIGETYHPRILFGMYQISSFERELDVLRGAGIEVIPHTSCECTNLTKHDNSFTIRTKNEKFGIQDIELDIAVVATGRWSNKTNSKSNRYIEDIWPASKMKDQTDNIAREEIAKRQAAGDNNKVVTIAIEGSRLSAIDVLKTIARDGTFITDEAGNVVGYRPQENPEYIIKVDMISRSGVLPHVKSRPDYLKQVYGATSVPQDLKFDNAQLDILAQTQDNIIYQWQVYAMSLRTIELSYTKVGNEEMAEKCRQLLAQIVNCISKDREVNSYDIKTTDSSSVSHFMIDIISKFGLECDEANYARISQLIKDSLITEATPIEQLKLDLQNARVGDVKDTISTQGNDEGNYLIWANVYRQVDMLSSFKYLPIDERIYRSSIMDVFHETLINSMPPIAAQEIISLHDCGILEFVQADANKVFVDKNGEETEERDRVEGEEFCDRKVKIGELEYDIVINTRGLGRNLKNCPPLYQSLQDQGLIQSQKILVGSREEYDEILQDLEEKYGTQDAQKIHKELQRGMIEIDGQIYFDTSQTNITGLYATDEKGNRLSENLLFSIMSGGITGAISQGHNAAQEIVKICRTPSRSSSFTRSAETVEAATLQRT